MDYLRDLAQYNIWANQRLLQASDALETAALDRDFPTSFPTLRRTWYHLWDAEYIWLQRNQGLSFMPLPSQSREGYSEPFSPQLLACSVELARFVAAQNDAWFAQRCAYAGPKGLNYFHPHGAIVQHVLNHSSYHRGQVVSFLRQLGAQSVPSTDFITWWREKEPPVSAPDA
jgi:uncharacterized damage-inducible protein DinB